MNIAPALRSEDGPPLPPPWKAEQIPGGYVVKDASGQSIAYVYARETKAQADTAKVLTKDQSETGSLLHR